MIEWLKNSIPSSPNDKHKDKKSIKNSIVRIDLAFDNE